MGIAFHRPIEVVTMGLLINIASRAITTIIRGAYAPPGVDQMEDRTKQLQVSDLRKHLEERAYYQFRAKHRGRMA